MLATLNQSAGDLGILKRQQALATACRVIGQGHRGREKSHFALAGPELQRAGGGFGDDDPAVEPVEMVLPIVHMKRGDIVADRCSGVLRSKSALRQKNRRDRG